MQNLNINNAENDIGDNQEQNIKKINVDEPIDSKEHVAKFSN